MQQYEVRRITTMTVQEICSRALLPLCLVLAASVHFWWVGRLLEGEKAARGLR
jgi:hypothetical protein